MIHDIKKDYILNIILEHSEDLITIKDLNMRYLACNKSFLNHFGFSDYNEVINKNIKNLFPEDAKFFEDIFNQILKTTSPQISKINIQNKKELKILKQTNTPIIQNGLINGILSISSDITQEEYLKEKLMEKVYQLNALLECLPLLVYMKNKNKEFIWGANAAKEFIENGFDRFSNNIKLNLNCLKQGENEDDDYVLKNKKTLITEKMIPDYNNREHWYKIQKAPILAENNEIKGLVTIVENIDEAKMLENRKNLFLATLGHDLKNPLLAQINSLELIYKGAFGALNDVQKEMLEMTLESSKYMRDMLYSLLKTCKESNGIIKLQRQYFDITKLIKTCIKEISDFARNKQIQIIFNTQYNNENFFADETEIRRVLSNLLNNTVNYAFENSIININLCAKNGYLLLSFENRSQEITTDMQKHIFDKYVCDNSLKSNFGVGLGLYFCKKVIEAHEGTIYVNSEGTLNTFYVELPILDEKSVILSEIVL